MQIYYSYLGQPYFPFNISFLSRTAFPPKLFLLLSGFLLIENDSAITSAVLRCPAALSLFPDIVIPGWLITG